MSAVFSASISSIVRKKGLVLYLQQAAAVVYKGAEAVPAVIARLAEVYTATK